VLALLPATNSARGSAVPSPSLAHFPPGQHNHIQAQHQGHITNAFPPVTGAEYPIWTAQTSTGISNLSDPAPVQNTVGLESTAEFIATWSHGNPGAPLFPTSMRHSHSAVTAVTHRYPAPHAVSSQEQPFDIPASVGTSETRRQSRVGYVPHLSDYYPQSGFPAWPGSAGSNPNQHGG
jgi:hypothetical protein